ncbi:Acyl-CoA dehydrogenase [Streptomyces sp. YIM 130001]|uniref:acyl-CoA dehydrogenase n=1 Tax=Streptomyces sp. YIM 130001 TaxID=2259644 RepID=UPI000E648091|nr:acyl-CoA dehydrogenase [Streptomyces sp. YIM 130001]RII17819.1 Acyl-CoA dehydrogenase [Streptomyces sp. YIM 130001]
MRFLLDAETREFARSLDGMLGSTDTPGAVRAWAGGEHEPGRALWARLAEAGVFALAVPERYGGLGPLPVELAVAFTELGRHAVPGPAVETVAAAALLARLDAGGAPTTDGPADGLLPDIASGKRAVSLSITAPHGSAPAGGAGAYALDADAADAVLVADGDTLRLSRSCGPVQHSFDPARRLSEPGPGGTVLARGPAVTAAATHAADVAALMTAAQSLGVGKALLSATVEYAKQRSQFGVPIGSFQAVKHRLADTLLDLEFATPVVHAAALALGRSDPAAGREIAAAKVTAGEAAYRASHTALHLHGALGYTDELDLSLWIRKARPLRDAWGTPAACRARILSGVSAGWREEP